LPPIFSAVEVLLIYIVEGFLTDPVNACRLGAVIVENVLERFFNPFPFVQVMVQVFKVMGSVSFGFPG
jgi:hypothetical protein